MMLSFPASSTCDESSQPQNVSVAKVGAVWRAWVSLIPAADLPPLLKSGSTGPQSAGLIPVSAAAAHGTR